MDYPCMQQEYYAVRLWCHTERKTQTINATKHQGAAGRHECSPGKVLQSENQSKHIKADIGLGFLIRCLEQSRAGKINLWLCYGTEGALQLIRSMFMLTVVEVIEHSPFTLENESAG